MTGEGPETPDPTALFEKHRSVLIGAAYRILGSRSDAEDVVQEAWLRWSQVEYADRRRAPCLPADDHLAARPEPASPARPRARRPTSGRGCPSRCPRIRVKTARRPPSSPTRCRWRCSSCSSRSARSSGRRSCSPRSSACPPRGGRGARPESGRRTPAHPPGPLARARATAPARVDAAKHREITERFIAAAGGGDIATLMELLAPDVVLVTDGGGIKQAALRPIHGADKVLRCSRV